MRNKQSYLYLLILPFIFGCGPNYQYPALPPGAKVLAFGDSLTAGVGAKEGSDYPSILASKTGWKVFNYGVSGETTEGGIRRFSKVVEEVNPHLIILGLGGNDFMKGVPERVTKENLKKMINFSREKNIPIILFAVPKVSPSNLITSKIGFSADIHPIYIEIEQEEKILVEKNAAPKIWSSSSLMADNIHPNGEGYKVFVEDYLIPVFKKEKII